MKDFVLRSLRAIFDFFVAKPAQGVMEVGEGIAAIVPELVQAAGRAVAAQLTWASKVRIGQGADKVCTGAGKMLPAVCGMLVVLALAPAAWPLILYLTAAFFILDLPTASVTSRDGSAAQVVG